MKLRNLWLALRDQGPLKRFWHNFFVTGNARGLFHRNSHVSQRTGELKVMYGRRASAEKAAEKMAEKHGFHYSVYKCVWCDGFHIGRNLQNKPTESTQ